MARARLRGAGIALASLIAAGCVDFGGIADSLGESIAAQRDPAVVRDGGPAYLILVDTFARRAPDDADAQLAAARLYGAYAGGFVDDPERRRILTQTAYDYARAGLCLRLQGVCDAIDARFKRYRETLSGVHARNARVLYRFAAAWAGWVRARSDDYGALADLPKIEATFERVLELDADIDHGFAHAYLGVLLTQRPAALGGEPERARKHFERAIEISDGRNLMVKTLFAEHYARLVFDRELHARLIDDVLAADPIAGDLTLSNKLAQRRARGLRASAGSFF